MAVEGRPQLRPQLRLDALVVLPVLSAPDAFQDGLADLRGSADGPHGLPQRLEARERVVGNAGGVAVAARPVGHRLQPVVRESHTEAATSFMSQTRLLPVLEVLMLGGVDGVGEGVGALQVGRNG